MQRSHTRAWRTVIAAVAVTALSALTQTAAMAADKLTLDSGHTDIFNVTADAKGLHLTLKEDVTGEHVLHAPEDVKLVVKKEAFQSTTANMEELGVSGYLLPLNQDAKLLWPGWDTLGVQPQGFGAININFLEVTGPGRVFLFTGGSFGGIAPLLKGDGYELKTASVREQSYPAHTHAYWLFEKPGEYTMKVNATGELNGKIYTSNTGVYHWQVGDPVVAEPEPSNGNEKPGDNTPAPGDNAGNPGDNAGDPHQPPHGPNPGSDPSLTPGATPTVAPSVPGATAPNSAPPSATAGNTPAAPPAAPAVAAATCFPHQEGGSGAETLLPRLKDDRSAPPRWVDPASVTFLVGPKGNAKAPQAIGSIPAGSSVWMIGATQVRGVPWVGANTMNSSIMDKTTGEVTWQLTSFSGPGTMEVFTSGNFGQLIGQKWFSGSGNSGSGAITIPRNTHVHPNWVFSAPGTYKVGITQTATKKDGTRISGNTVLTFNVGSGGGIDDGHFDLGSEVGAAGSKTVWRDAKGQLCTPTAADYAAAGMSPSGSLATTGTSELTLSLVMLAVGIGVLGAGILRYRGVL